MRWTLTQAGFGEKYRRTGANCNKRTCRASIITMLVFRRPATSASPEQPRSLPPNARGGRGHQSPRCGRLTLTWESASMNTATHTSTSSPESYARLRARTRMSPRLHLRCLNPLPSPVIYGFPGQEILPCRFTCPLLMI